MIFKIALMVLLFSSLTTRQSQAQTDAPRSRYKFYILSGDFMSLRLGYNLEQSWPILQAIALDDPLSAITGNGFVGFDFFRTSSLENALAVITEDDLATYDWYEQILTLTPSASARLIELLGLHTGEEGDWVSNHDLYQQAFVVTLDDKPLYGGIFLPLISAMGIQYPVVGLDSTNPDQLTLRILPYQGGLEDYSQGGRFINDEIRAMIENPDLKAFLDEQGLLTESLHE